MNFVVQVPWFCKGCSEWDTCLLISLAVYDPYLNFIEFSSVHHPWSFILSKWKEINWSNSTFIFELPCSSGSDRKVRWRETNSMWNMERRSRFPASGKKKCFSSRDIQFWPSPPTNPGQTLLINQRSLSTKQKAASESFLSWCSRHPPTINKRRHKRRDLFTIPFIPPYCASGKQYYKLRKKKETSEIEKKHLSLTSSKSTIKDKEFPRRLSQGHRSF